ncbi:MAG: hypothetical protein M0P91_08145 [Sulfuricurvum sp.]|jgi:hypothetical protein|uniref:hypothetical protein n=1 Tax=Sulfuricurvum sp. TaxID=2025608 RepID=UPI0025F97DC0|nr:hypothetical protein [Sulfuricurvum sp.]MCK9373156.1 hypothetical protein [Sulfuricurvum sp.]
MKRNPGNILLLWLLSAAALWGETYRWEVLKAPESLRVGQSGVIRYTCTFEGSAANYTVEFKPQGSDAYRVQMLTQDDRIVKGRRVETFDVLVTPLRGGMIDLRQEALIRHTTFASIENATIGRDNVKKYDFNDEKTSLPAVGIRAEENSAALTGRITVEVKSDRPMVRAHEPFHLSVYVRGSGNLDQFVPYELNISGVTVFAEPPQKSITPASDGYEGEIRQEFALIAEKSYVIAPLRLRVFDTAENRIKELKTLPIHVEVSEGYEPSTLLDPPDLSDTSTLKRYALYAALVLGGAGIGEAVRRLWRLRPRRKIKYFWDEAKTSKELVLLLSLAGEKRYNEMIGLLEAGEIGLGEAKKRLASYSNRSE